jgi:hypothetical protein
MGHDIVKGLWQAIDQIRLAADKVHRCVPAGDGGMSCAAGLVSDFLKGNLLIGFTYIKKFKFNNKFKKHIIGFD